MDRKEAQKRLDQISDDSLLRTAMLIALCKDLIAQLPEPATGDRQEVITALGKLADRYNDGSEDVTLLRSAIDMLRAGAVQDVCPEAFTGWVAF